MEERCKHQLVKAWCAACNGTVPVGIRAERASREAAGERRETEKCDERSSGIREQKPETLKRKEKIMNEKPKERQCKGQCGRTLPLTDDHFRRNKNGRDGFEGKCRDCRRDERNAARLRRQAGAPKGKPKRKKPEVRTTAGSSFEVIGRSVGRLVEEKNRAYGDSFGKSGQVLRAMYPEGIRPEQYDDMLCVVRIIDKLFRVATDRDALGENPFRDVAGYGILAISRQGAA